MAAAACGAIAGLLRQVGLHRRAGAADQEGLSRLAAGPPEAWGAAWREEVHAALLVGAVADGIGAGVALQALEGRLAAAAEAVARAGGWRQPLRLRWVAGELALLAGDVPEARAAFSEALARAARAGARRHAAKSLLFAAAAAAAAGDRAAADEQAGRSLELSTACQATPLRWPALLVRAEVAAAGGALLHARGLQAEAAQVLGALLAELPEPLAGEAADRPPASWLLAGR